jgi:hypothetical protein
MITGNGSEVRIPQITVISRDPSLAMVVPSVNTSYHFNNATGAPGFITFGSGGSKISESSTNDPARIALGFFRTFPLIFGTGDVDN